MKTVVNWNGKWAFTKQCDRVPDRPPEDWDWVNLPHTWNGIDGQDGGGDYWRGVGYYAKTFSKSELPKAEVYVLEFQGVNSTGEVYLNGQFLGRHEGGYSTWRVHLEEALQEENLLVVTADNRPNDQVYPQMADFTFYGGIYRDVWLICVDRSHFDLDYYGGAGLMVTPQVQGADGLLEVEVFVTNFRPGQRLRYTLMDDGGQTIRQVETDRTKVSIQVPGVHLWHGRDDPYLYRCRVDLLGEELLDTVQSVCGFRSFHIDPDKGFFLNGKSYPLRGVSRHQDRWGKGNALSPEDHQEDLELICQMGANSIRLAHYQHDQRFYDLCDRYGQIVWAEIPFISKFMEQGVDNTVQQMQELIVQNYNHPSIVVWGLSNEITISGSSPQLLENHRRLNDLCHILDKTRLTTMAVVSPCPMDDPYLLIPDTLAYNHYFGWYGGDPSMNGPWFDRFHALHPNIPIGCSEYGCEGMDWHSSQPQQGDYTEEYQAHYHEELIKQLFTRPYLWATYVWNMFDFGADARNEGGENGQNHKGLVTFDRGYRKDAYYAYRAWLSREPFVHLCGKRYVDRVEDVTRVTVYSNLPEVELLANGKSLGRQQSAEHFFYFQVPNVGETELEARAGDCADRSRLRKVERFNESYRMREQGAVLNWFDLTMPEGRLSVNHPIGTIMQVPEGAGLLFELFRWLASRNQQGESNDLMTAALNSFTPDSPMMQMMGGFTVLRLAGMLGPGVDREVLLELNTALNRLELPKDAAQA